MKVAQLSGPLGLMTAIATLAHGIALADTAGTIGGAGAFSRNCTWACRPQIKTARGRYCFDEAGRKKLVDRESMPVRCGGTQEGG